jgi:membrane protease YdiL (CAAX protease family)
MTQTTNNKEIKQKVFWQRIPRWLLPVVLIVVVLLLLLVAQYAATIILSIYAVIRGWNQVQANQWLRSSVTAQFFFILMAETFTVGLIYLLLKYINHTLWDIGLKWPKLKDGGLALLAYPVYFILFIILLTIAIHLFPSLNVNQTQHIGFNSVHGVYQLTLTFVSLVILAPIAEELLFRGVLFEGLKKVMPVIYAGILTSLVFASAHLPEGGSSGPLWVGGIDIFTLSMVLVFLKQKTKSLWPGIFLHAIKNLVAFISLFILTSR